MDSNNIKRDEFICHVEKKENEAKKKVEDEDIWIKEKRMRNNRK